MRKKSAKSKSEEKTHKHSRRRRKSSSSESEVESSEVQNEQSEEPKTRRTRKTADKEVENNTVVGGRVTRHSRRLAAISASSDELKESTPELLSPAKTGKSSPYSTGSPVKDNRKKDGTPDKHKGKDSTMWKIESANGSGLQKLKIRRQRSPETTQTDDMEADNETEIENDNCKEFSTEIVGENNEIISEKNVDLESIVLPEECENNLAEIQLPPTEPKETVTNSQPTLETSDITSQIVEDFVEIGNIELPPEPEPQPVIKDIQASDSTEEHHNIQKTVSEISLPNEQPPEEIPLPNESTDVDKIEENKLVEEHKKEERVEEAVEKRTEVECSEIVTNSEIVSSPQQALSEQEDGFQAELVLTVEDNVMEEQTSSATANDEDSASTIKQVSETPKKESILPSMSHVEMEEVYDYEHDDTREEGELSANEAMSPIHEVFKKLPAEERKRSWGACKIFHFNRTKLIADEQVLKERNIIKRVINKDDLESSESEDLIFVKEIREENIIHEIESETNNTLIEKEYDEVRKGDGIGVRKRHTLESDKIIDKPSKRHSKESRTVSGEGKTVLYITNLVRPFTVNQLRELLQRTGRIVDDGFWIDSIKSKCYVQFENEDQTIETRHALHGIRWPVNNPKVLSVHFATPDDLIAAQAQIHESETPRKTEPLIISNHNSDASQKHIDWKKHFEQYDERPRKVKDVREWDIGKPAHPDDMVYMDENEFKKKEDIDPVGRSRRDRKRKGDLSDDESQTKRHKKSSNNTQPPPEAKLLDDLFRRTKASPSIYWLPLSEEQITVKQETRRKHLEDIDRQMKNRGDRDPRRRDRDRRRSRR